MFNLEQSISEWRLQMLSMGVKNPEIVDELESHLREDVARRTHSGASDQQAFASAAQAIGQASALKFEFEKLNGKRGWLRKFSGVIARVLDPVPALNLFTPGALRTLELARHEAPRLKHGFIGTEHLLLGLLALEDGVVPDLLKTLGVDRQGLKRQIETWVSDFASSKKNDRFPLTPRVNKSLRLAVREAKAFSHARVGPEHLFLGLLMEGEGVAGQILKSLGLNTETIRKEILRRRKRNGL